MTEPLDELLACTGFQWDEANAEKNWIKHKVGWPECEEVFFATPLLVAIDEKHSGPEARFYGLGQTDERRLLFVVFTIRERLIRVISARDMSRRERRAYEQAKG